MIWLVGSDQRASRHIDDDDCDGLRLDYRLQFPCSAIDVKDRALTAEEADRRDNIRTPTSVSGRIGYCDKDCSRLKW